MGHGCKQLIHTLSSSYLHLLATRTRGGQRTTHGRSVSAQSCLAMKLQPPFQLERVAANLSSDKGGWEIGYGL